MRKALLFCSLIFACLAGQSQNGIFVGVSPYSFMKLKSKGGPEHILTSQYNINRPPVQIGFSLAETHDNILFDFCYAPKQRFTSSDGSEDLFADHWGAHMYFGDPLIHDTRIQPCFYVSIGLSRYKEPISKLYIDVGAKFRLLVFITKQIAFFAEGSYCHSFNAKYYAESSIEAGTGLAVYFKPVLKPRSKTQGRGR